MGGEQDTELELEGKNAADKAKWMEVLDKMIWANDEASASLHSQLIPSNEDFEATIRKKVRLRAHLYDRLCELTMPYGS